MRNYRNRPNYTRNLFRPDGTVLEVVKHCGKCMGIIVSVDCGYCFEKARKKALRFAALKKLPASAQ